MYSIIIPTYGSNGIAMVDNLLDSISKFDNPALDEVVISDDSSNVDTMSGMISLMDKYKDIFNIIPVFNPSYHSFSKTVNSGLKISNSNNDILLLNNDMLALTSFEPFVDFMYYQNNINIQNNNRNKIGIIGAKLLFPSHRIQHAGMVRMKLTKNFRHIYKYRDNDYPPANIQKKYISVTGACIYINRELINKIGFLDEAYILSYEDVDYCVNCQANGYDVWYIPSVMMIHLEMITRKDPYGTQNKKLFWDKWGSSYDNIKTNQGILDDDLEVKIVGASCLTGLLYLTA